jgi:FkbM family methyltransferase
MSGLRKAIDSLRKARLAARLLDPTGRIRIWRNRRRGYGFCLGDIQVPIDNSQLSSEVEGRIARGSNQLGEFKAARHVILPGDTVVELGGGIGILSTAIRLKTDASRVVCFEPNPDLGRYIEATHRQNGVADVEVRQSVVLSGVPDSKTATLYVNADFSASSLYPLGGTKRQIEASVTRLDDMLSELDPTVLILDIEGAELELFEGAEGLGRVDRIMIELHPAIYGDAGVLKLFRELCRLGFAYQARGSSGAFVVFRRLAEPQALKAE